MQYEAVYLYNNRNEFIGVAIKKANTDLLHSVNIWRQTDNEIEDFKRTLRNLNEKQNLRRFWPDANDPDVQDLVNDPDWEPLELHEESVPDWEKSEVVDDQYGGIDMEKSKIVYMKAWVPDPSDAQDRFYKAQETVARYRSEVDNSDAT